MKPKRRVTYLTGTRADFGLMEPILQAIHGSDSLELELIVTGMHLTEKFGRTEDEIVRSGIPIAKRIEVPVNDDSGHAMGRMAGLITAGVADYLAERPRDFLLLLGDRGEMLAGATAALFSETVIVHIAGGERSGSVDDSIRHAISKLAHIHCVSIEDGRLRLQRMGEAPDRIHVVGAPGLVGLSSLASAPLAALASQYGFSASRSLTILLFHPVVQDGSLADAQWQEVFSALAETNHQILCLMPNADHGGTAIRRAIEDAAPGGRLIPITHMPRRDYLSALRHSAFLIGNSSSGIVEAATLGTAVVNVGDRQNGRLRGANVFDAVCKRDAIAEAIRQAEKFDATGLANVYGAQLADQKVREILEQADLTDPGLRKKSMSY